MSDCPGKNSWPELVGKNGNDAAAVIEKENRNVDAIVLKDGTPTTKDFRCDRVWVWVNDNGVVLRSPTIGKNLWPELVGANGERAAAMIEKQNLNVDAVVIEEGTPVTDDFRCDRVRVWVDRYGVVVRVPSIG